jgi:hypothetical protein
MHAFNFSAIFSAKLESWNRSDSLQANILHSKHHCALRKDMATSCAITHLGNPPPDYVDFLPSLCLFAPCMLPKCSRCLVQTGSTPILAFRSSHCVIHYIQLRLTQLVNIYSPRSANNNNIGFAAQ